MKDGYNQNDNQGSSLLAHKIIKITARNST